MTQTLSSAARAPASAKNGAGDAADLSEGQIVDGKIAVWTDGRLRPVTRWEAIGVLVNLAGSPIPESQVRARRIRAALDQIGAVQ